MSDQDKLIEIIKTIIQDENEIHSKISVRKHVHVEFDQHDRIIYFKLVGLPMNIIPAEIFMLNHVETLIVSGSEANFISEDATFGNLSKLTRLDLSYNELSTIPEGITNLTSLIELDLSMNPIVQLPNNMGNLSSFKFLLLKGAKLESLDNIYQLSPLEYLNIAINTNNYNISDDIANLAQLTHLYLDGDKLNKISEKFAELPLEILNLKFAANVTEIPAVITRLTSLRELMISGEGLVQITGLSELDNLISIRIIESTVVDFPELPPSIELVKIAGRIQQIPDNISKYQALTTLILAGNQIKTLPDALYGMNLTHLHLDNNHITEISPKINTMRQLVQLTLSGNQLSELPHLSQLINLEKLYLGNNMLTKLPPSITRLKELRELAVESNSLTSIPDFTKKPSQRWMTLDDEQREKQLKKLSVKAKLRWINLSDNNFGPKSLHWLQNLEYIETLIIDSNHTNALGSGYEEAFQTVIKDYKL